MSETELRELREWAAKVCGHERKLDGLGDGAEAFIIEVEGGELDYWLPDQNIAQAFEVLDATFMAFRNNSPVWIISGDYEGASVELNVARDAETFICEHHESRCMAILLACKKALSE